MQLDLFGQASPPRTTARQRLVECPHCRQSVELVNNRLAAHEFDAVLTTVELKNVLEHPIRPTPCPMAEKAVEEGEPLIKGRQGKGPKAGNPRSGL